MKILKDNTYIAETLAEVEFLARHESKHNWRSYWAYDRTEKEIKWCVYIGKYGELFLTYVIYKFYYKLGYRLVSGCQLNSKHPDNGTDLQLVKVDDSNNKRISKVHNIQLKTVKDKYYNITKNVENTLKKLKNYDGIIIVYSRDQQKLYELTKDIINDDIFKDDILDYDILKNNSSSKVHPSNYKGVYINVSDMKEYYKTNNQIKELLKNLKI